MIQPSLTWLLFSFKGRIARQSFLLSGLLLLLPQIYFFIQILQLPENSPENTFWAMVWLAILVVTLWSALALTVKRLHDLGLPSVLAVLMIVLTINFITLLVLAFMPSKNKTNEHGPPLLVKHRFCATRVYRLNHFHD